MKKIFNYTGMSQPLINIKFELIISIILYLVFFYDFASIDLYGYFKFGDELIVYGLLLIATYWVLYTGKLYLYTEEKIILIALTILLTIGVISSIYYGYQRPIAVINDIVVFFKPFIAYFSTRIVFNNIDIEIYKEKIQTVLILLFIAISLTVVLDLIYDIFPKDPVRFGIYPIQLFFGHPSRYAFALSMLFILLYALDFPLRKLTLIFILVVGAMSLRYKYLGFSAIALYSIFFMTGVSAIRLRKYLFIIIILGAIVFTIGYDRILFFTSEDAISFGYARTILHYFSFILAIDHFPLGSGFATFASHFSGVYYSPIYLDYEIYDVKGLREHAYHFVSDTFWPMILGQIGFFGLFLYVFIIGLYFKLLISLFNTVNNVQQKKLMISALLVLFLISIESLADSSFVQNRGVASFFILAIFVNMCTSNHKAVPADRECNT